MACAENSPINQPADGRISQFRDVRQFKPQSKRIVILTLMRYDLNREERLIKDQNVFDESFFPKVSGFLLPQRKLSVFSYKKIG